MAHTHYTLPELGMRIFLSALSLLEKALREILLQPLTSFCDIYSIADFKNTLVLPPPLTKNVLNMTNQGSPSLLGLTSFTTLPPFWASLHA